MLAEQNPHLSMAGNTYDFYCEFFHQFVMPKVCFAFWDIMNNQEDFENWPEAAKMDFFIEACWKNNYEDDIRAKFIYNLFWNLITHISRLFNSEGHLAPNAFPIFLVVFIFVFAFSQIRDFSALHNLVFCISSSICQSLAT